ncbi:hypothetical protein RYH80_10310 [Halobaculum sp. MBLA0147]|uniref:EMC6-like membrane protein n=1 Tax=Halobaculum sp. MBLA0147 TaxID=3079934 RepID=UPI0035256B20
MATETTTGLSDHLRGVTVTTLACVGGIVAALASAQLFGVGLEAATSRLSLGVVAVVLAVQYPLLKLIGVDVSEFGVKDNLYVVFMTFTFWFISYAVLLSTGV